MFGMVQNPRFNNRNFEFQGDQIRGFGVGHDGTMDTIFRFHDQNGFNEAPGVTGFPPGAAGDVLRGQVTAFLHAFDSNLAPIVGQQATLAGAGDTAAELRVDLLIARADAGSAISWRRSASTGMSRASSTRPMARSGPTGRRARRSARRRCARSRRPNKALTFTCAPPGSGTRMALDRDGDGALDGDEEDAGSDPADPASTP